MCGRAAGVVEGDSGVGFAVPDFASVAQESLIPATLQMMRHLSREKKYSTAYMRL